MFSPTQTKPAALAAFMIVVGTSLTVAFTVMALINTEDSGVLSVLGTYAPVYSGPIFLTGICIFIATLRPLPGGILLAVTSVVVLIVLPAIGGVGLAFAALSLLRATLARRHLKTEAEEEPATASDAS